ncbi:MAG: Rieske 2Fe-2S domain-containing protein [Pseudomonadota bacterium]
MSWTDYRDAPAPGTILARASDVPEGGTTTLTLGAFPVLLARGAAGLRAFVNACPHQYLPLDHKGDGLMSADGTRLRCTNHSAGFDAGTGEGVEGLGHGCALEAIPVVEESGEIRVAAS